LLCDDRDLLGHGGRVARVAGEDPHRQRVAVAVGQQPDDDLERAPLAVPVVAERAQGVVFAFQVAAAHVIQEQGGRCAAAGQRAAVERLLDLLLPRGEIVECGIERLHSRGIADRTSRGSE
jgi:hypothetical protein